MQLHCVYTKQAERRCRAESHRQLPVAVKHLLMLAVPGISIYAECIDQGILEFNILNNRGGGLSHQLLGHSHGVSCK